LGIIEKYLDKIDYFISEKDLGLYHARNKGILKASGDYIGFLNTDDTYENGALLTIGHFFSNNFDIDLVYGVAARISKEGDFIHYFGDFKFDKDNYFKYSPTIPDQATFFKRKCLAEVGLFDLKLKFGADTDIWKRFAKNNLKIMHIDKYIGNWRIHENTLSYKPEYKWERIKEGLIINNRYAGKYLLFRYWVTFIDILRLNLRNMKWLKKLYLLLKRK